MTYSRVAMWLGCKAEQVEEIATRAGWRVVKYPAGKKTKLAVEVTTDEIKAYRKDNSDLYRRDARPFTSLNSQIASIRLIGVFNSIWKMRRRDEQRRKQETNRRNTLQRNEDSTLGIS